MNFLSKKTLLLNDEKVILGEVIFLNTEPKKLLEI